MAELTFAMWHDNWILKKINLIKNKFASSILDGYNTNLPHGVLIKILPKYTKLHI